MLLVLSLIIKCRLLGELVWCSVWFILILFVLYKLYRVILKFCMFCFLFFFIVFFNVFILLCCIRLCISGELSSIFIVVILFLLFGVGISCCVIMVWMFKFKLKCNLLCWFFGVKCIICLIVWFVLLVCSVVIYKCFVLVNDMVYFMVFIEWILLIRMILGVWCSEFLRVLLKDWVFMFILCWVII